MLCACRAFQISMKAAAIVVLSIAVLCVALVEAQHPRRCEAPEEFESHAIQFNHKEKFGRRGHFAYDAKRERTAIFEEVRNGTDDEHFHVIHLHREQRRYVINLKSKVCTTEISNERFHPIGIHKEAHFRGEAIIGTNAFENAGLITTHWDHQNKTAQWEWYGVFTDREVGCIPVSDDFMAAGYGHTSTQFFDVVLGISDPNIFVPPSSCSSHVAPAETSGDVSIAPAGEFNGPYPVEDPESGWSLFKQCDPQWANQELGTCGGTTICAAGCAMSSVAMILRTKGVSTNPGSFNTWLKSAGGYADGCELVWGAADKYGKTSFQGIETADYGTICAGINAGHGIVANVRDGSHWVLLTGCDGGSTFYVNDPGFDQSTYTYSDVLREAVYH